jgi:hypothetical protein
MKSRDIVICHLMYKNGAQPSQHFQNNAVLDAAREGSVTMISLLNDCRADLNFADYNLVCCPMTLK